MEFPSLVESIVDTGITNVKWTLIHESVKESKNRLRFLEDFFDEIQSERDGLDNNFKCVFIAFSKALSLPSEMRIQFELDYVEGAWKWGTTPLSSGNCYLAIKVCRPLGLILDL